MHFLFPLLFCVSMPLIFDMYFVLAYAPSVRSRSNNRINFLSKTKKLSIKATTRILMTEAFHWQNNHVISIVGNETIVYCVIYFVRYGRTNRTFSYLDSCQHNN